MDHHSHTRRLTRGLMPVALTGALLAPWPAPAQQPDETAGTRVLQGVGDVDALSASLGLAPVDLRQPVDFEALYRDDGSGLYYRVSGGIIAAFSRSEYGPNGAIVPAGTEFYIGPPARSLAEEEAAIWAGATGFGPISNLLAPGETARVDLREAWMSAGTVARRFIAPAPGDSPRGAPPIARNIGTDEAYRQARLERLVLHGAEATPNTTPPR